MSQVEVIIAGVGMTRFVKPAESPSYVELAQDAVRQALQDAGLAYERIEQAYVGYVYGDTTSGQRVLYGLGVTGIPVINVNNACATGSTALFLARQAVATGAAECVLALGFEQMSPGALDLVFPAKTSPLDPFLEVVATRYPEAANAPPAVALFSAAGKAYQDRYGADNALFAEVRAKASRHAVHNERAIFRKEMTAQDVLASPPLFLNVTRLQACPPTCGAAAAIVCSADFARRAGIDRTVRVRAQAMRTDGASTFEGNDPMEAVGATMAAETARAVYEAAGVGPQDIQVAELHDCFTTNEVLTYEALGFCGAGAAAAFVADGANTYGGRVVTNPSGGLLSKGHPLGATGLAQCAELVWQLRGEAGQRQVEGARMALQHNLGIGGACVVTLYEARA